MPMGGPCRGSRPFSKLGHLAIQLGFANSIGSFCESSDAGRRHSDGLGTRVPTPSVPEAPPPSPAQLNGKCVKLGSRLGRLTSLIRWANFQAETFLDPAAQHRGQGITCLSHKVGMDHFEGGGSNRTRTMDVGRPMSERKRASSPTFTGAFWASRIRR